MKAGRWTGCALVLLAPVVAGGCASARLSFSAKRAQFPISLSEGFFHGDELVLRERYEILHHFRLTHSRLTLNALAGPKTVDLADEFQSLVAAHNGEAIVNLSVKAYDSVWTSLMSFTLGPPTLGLVCPGFVGAVIEGDVVRLRAAPARGSDQGT